MPLGYLFTLVALGALTALALLRFRRWGHILFAPALLAGELPHIALLFLVASTALALAEDDLNGPAGAALLGFALLITVGLIVLLTRALRAHSVVAAMLRQHGAPPAPRRWVRALAFPFPVRPRSVVRTGPVPYGPDKRQRLDLYRPARGDQVGPVLVYLHGGGYSSGGNRREARALLHHLTARGWTCISATYRLRPRFGFEDHLADARAVLAWAHAHVRNRGAGDAPVVMAGSSAGGHLAALCALTQDDDPQYPRADAVVSLYAWYDRYWGRGRDETPVSTAFALDASKAPPFFVVHGDHDSFVPVERARALRDHLTRSSPNEVWYAELPGAQHGFDVFASWRFRAVIDGIDAFVQRAVGPARGRAPGLGAGGKN